jgi:hypothetical protein
MDELDGFSLKVRQYPKKKLPYQILKLNEKGIYRNITTVRTQQF